MDNTDIIIMNKLVGHVEAEIMSKSKIFNNLIVRIW